MKAMRQTATADTGTMEAPGANPPPLKRDASRCAPMQRPMAAQRPVRRSRPRTAKSLPLAGALMALWFLAPGAPVQAQTETLVTNNGERGTSSTRAMMAQSFTTGSNLDGYTLDGIQFSVQAPTISSTVTVFVTIRENRADDRPGNVVAELSTPVDSMGRATFNGNDIFTAPANTRLVRNRTYWVVVNNDAALNAANQKRANFARVSRTGQTGMTGWSIGNVRLWRNRVDEPWEQDSTTHLRFTVLGSSVNPVDETGSPTIQSVSVDSWWVTLTFSEPLDETQRVSAKRFRLHKAGETAVQALEGGQVRPAGRTVTLKTEYPLSAWNRSASDVEVTYYRPRSGGIQDLGGNRAESFTRHRGSVLTNNETPTLLQVDIDGNEVDLIYNWGLDTSRGAPHIGAFAVRHPDGTEVAVTGVRLGGAGGVTLTLASAARYGEHGWTVSYEASSTSRPLRVGNGNVRSFQGFVALNHTLPAHAPRLVRAVWHSGDTFDPSTRTVEQRNWIRLTYDQPLKTTAPPASAFTVTAGGEAMTVNSTSVFNELLILTLSSAVPSSVLSCDLRVSYDRPSRNRVTGQHSNQAAAALDAVPVNRLQNDGKGAPCEGLSVADTTASEGSRENARFVVSLEPALTKTVTVRYATSDGTAIGGQDYIVNRGTLTFAPGETRKTVTVIIVDDLVEDSGETFTLTLSNAVGAPIVDATATGTIFNKEDVPHVTGVELVADASGDGRWTAGETVEVRLTFSEAVTVSGGSPWLEVSVDGVRAQRLPRLRVGFRQRDAGLLDGRSGGRGLHRAGGRRGQPDDERRGHLVGGIGAGGGTRPRRHRADGGAGHRGVRFPDR